MRSARRRPLAVVALAALAALPLLAAPVAAANPRSEHDRVVAYWTHERIASAKPRFTTFAKPGGPAPAAKPAPPPSSGLATTKGSAWPDNKGKVFHATGRVLFTMGTTNYICSASVATDARADISIVLTAGHCAYDQARRAFATNWIYIPEFDYMNSYDCAVAIHGCWTANRLVVHSGFANESGFTAVATRYDWAFAVINGNNGGSTELDATVGSFPIAFNGYASGVPVAAFGYPAGGRYNGNNDLIYCYGTLGTDPYNANLTYKLPCDMTGGSSGGPWLVDFSASGDSGTIMALNSYGYKGIVAMHGPKFNAFTLATWNAAVGNGTGNAVVSP
jgi:hypothetical protein